MVKDLTVGELRTALEGVPDDLKVILASDSGVDQGLGRIVIEEAKRITYSNEHENVDVFWIYCNDIEDEEENLADEELKEYIQRTVKEINSLMQSWEEIMKGKG